MEAPAKEDAEKKVKIDGTGDKNKLMNFLSKLIIFILAIIVAVFHYWHVSTMFENDRGFSELTQLEKEMSLKTEMGFYYYFYKTFVEERLMLNGIAKLAYNRIVEFPNEINAINRFNIYPEIITGALYHQLSPMLQRTWGSVEAISFYLNSVWCFAGTTLSMLFLSAVLLCGNIWGGALAVIQYIFNHAECTRVMWAPNERENWAQAGLIAQAALVTAQLRGSHGVGPQAAILVLNCTCLLFWQFSQFVFLTQLAILFIMEQLRIITVQKLMLILHAHFCGLHMAILFTQGNDMLVSSLYASFFAVISLYALTLSQLKVKNIVNLKDLSIEMWLILIRILIIVTASLWVKMIVSEFMGADEDSHIFDILYSKFTSFKSFHTMLYTCSPTFGFLPKNYFIKVTETGLLPLVCFGVSNVFYYWTLPVKKKETKRKKEKELVKIDDAEDSGIDDSIPKNQKNKKKEKKYNQITDIDKLEVTASIDESDNTIDNKTSGKAATDNKTSQKPIKDKRKPHRFILYLRSFNVDSGIFFNVTQMVVFGIMAVLIMRLKLLFTPQMCIVSSLAAQPAFYNRVLKHNRSAFLALGVALMVVSCNNGYKNFVKERSYYGDAYNPELSELLEWLSGTEVGSVIGASMPISSAVALSSRRPVVIHPHYENAALRQRVYSVYKMYGRFSPIELYAELSKLKVTHLVVDYQNCYSRSGLGCTFEDIWDMEVPGLIGKPRLCHLLLSQDMPHFYKEFSNPHYAVFRVHDYSLLYTPRLLDT